MERVRVGIGVMILSEGKILLGHRVDNYKDTGGIYEPGSWTFPGGKQELFETIYEGAQREVKEETDLDISDIEIYTAIDDIGVDRHYVTIGCIANSFNGTIKVMEPDIIDEWKFFAFDELPENIYSPTRNFLKYYMKKEGMKHE